MARGPVPNVVHPQSAWLRGQASQYAGCVSARGCDGKTPSLGIIEGEDSMTRTKAFTRTILRASTAMSALLLVEAGILAAPAMAQDVPPEEGTGADVSRPSGPVESQPTPTTSAEGEPVDSAQDIIVTGSRIPQPNLESASPVTVVSEADVKLTGATRIEDVLNQLPSVGAAQASGI